ncbi:LytR/AlgR family response regulator transcription factor [Pedobacter montanisoli]|uniref:LytTR family DNA-binding domain-containing protein n=1 Tax=Pedobacter montanisoli TaxID=2923277 RepID=A0ABS9ZWV3_9SPHI|nr:LytTR family DNA-binding domain-containing protein [Pedobacter montanisoli]MCJ0742777.1 LytTR family DNA-binding domain-containing protein [Pedobacter montanisoli]
MKIRTIIVDDEPHAIEVIEKYLENFQEISLVAKCRDGINAFHVLQQNTIDLMFLDVKMPGVTGVELLKSLKNPPKVIFTTAYSDYAIEGFELDAVDYLLKPIALNRFLKAMDKVLASMGARQQVMLAKETVGMPDVNKFLFLKVDRKTVKVNVKDIYWIESVKDYVKVILEDKVLLSKQKISVLEDLLPEEQFCRIHKSFIISIDKVDAYYSYAVEIMGKQLPIGRNYKQQAMRCLQEN